ncbi:fumarylacetoacetate hydrolase family protein [Kribbella kalugense]|uniref:2-keto-4-pentenoate hydratase/2-oxohepta-3-ene-1,7-dioic acid hydratase in catechol pathway n=1 Tax=Kribbella kalugense TaxID=2512221 RepID=A0A4R8A787_9ACTN|nr:fumarylacetoacetate hydrolase family protein [Kribbella kalugense]TDW24190.1 2-keto-4-pentenoate hydratase/2-oxohepta-3-ene-1,7-dioic acid hydratase in catechol pathway [Kribbella kalugense]
MRLVTYGGRSRGRPGVLSPAGDVVDLRALCASLDLEPPASVAEFIGQSPASRDRVGRRVAALDPERDRSWISPRGVVELLPPMGADVLVLATSGNYLSHLEEMGVTAAAPLNAFIVSPRSLVGDGQPIVLPAGGSGMVDWEGEFCVVFGRNCHRASAAEAMACVAGYTLFNDVSARDWVARGRPRDPEEAVVAWRNNIAFKQFPSFGPIGPAIVTVDEIPDPAELELVTTVTGAVMQRDRVGRMRRSIGEILAELSLVHRFEPGDVVTLGTPAGVGMAMSPPRFLRAGDEVTVSVAGIGRLRNPVLAR